MSIYHGLSVPGVISIILSVLIVMHPCFGQSTHVDTVVAMVNERPVYKSRLDSTVEQEIRLQKLNRDVSKQGQINVKEIRENKLEELILHELIMEQAVKNEISVSNTELQYQLNIDKAQFVNEQEYFRYINYVYGTYPEYRAAVSDQLLRRLVIQKLAGTENRITEKMMKEYYEKNLSRFEIPETRDLEYMTLFYTEEDTADDKKAARKFMEKILRELKQGNDIQSLRKQYDTEQQHIAAGTTLRVKKDKMFPELASAIFELTPGELSSVIENATGLHIFKCIKIYPSHTRDYDSSAYEIRERLHYVLYSAQEKQLIQDLKREADVRIFKQ